VSENELRQAVVNAARAMSASGLSRGTSGNVSARVPGGMLITPSAVPYHQLQPDDLIHLDLEGTVQRPSAGKRATLDRRPSTEWRMHARILAARPEVSAILHAHPTHSTALACLRKEIPAFHYMVAVAGGDSIRCAPYATFGTAELAEHALAALEARQACLLANHGMLALGDTPARALALAQEVETLAAQYCLALQLGEPAILDDRQMADVLDRFAAYGR
jgi:L-fuculose-phosphate aldolase